MSMLLVFGVSLLAGGLGSLISSFISPVLVKHPVVGFIAFLAGTGSIAVFNSGVGWALALMCGLLWVAGWQLFLMGSSLIRKSR